MCVCVYACAKLNLCEIIGKENSILNIQQDVVQKREREIEKER